MKFFTLLIAFACSMASMQAQCVATFQHTETNGVVSFYASSSGGGSNMNYTWDFGDGTTGSGMNTTHTYTVTQTTTFYACVTATDPVTGCSAVYCDYVIANPNSNPCNVQVTWTHTQSPLLGTSFASSISGFGPNVSYSWTFGNGMTSTAANPTVQLPAGTYQVCLTVTDGTCTQNYCNTISITSGNPCTTQVVWTHSQSPNGVSFVSSISGFSANASYSWTFGNGMTSTAANPTVQLPTGTYQVCLTVTDGTCTDTYCSSITVTSSNPCTTQVVWTHSQSPNGVSFVSSISGFSANASYSWTFGNGMTSTAANPTIPLATGTYQVCLVVTDGTCTQTYCNTITITNGNPCGGLAATFQYQAASGGMVVFWGTGSNSTGGGNNFVYTWTFGNGTSAMGAVVTHIFTGNPVSSTPNGNYYYVCLTVTDPTTGCSATYCSYVLVPPVPIVNPNTGGGPTSTGGMNNGPMLKPGGNTGAAVGLAVEKETNLLVSPNPTSNVLNVSIENQIWIDGSLSIVNVSGQIVHQQAISLEEGQTKFDLSVEHLPAGVYMVHLQGNDVQKTVKFVKQ